jgi:hypothetical protein
VNGEKNAASARGRLCIRSRYSRSQSEEIHVSTTAPKFYGVKFGSGMENEAIDRPELHECISTVAIAESSEPWIRSQGRQMMALCATYPYDLIMMFGHE